MYHISDTELVSPIISDALLSVLLVRAIDRGLLNALLRRCGGNIFVGAREGFHNQLSTGRTGQSGLESVMRFGRTMELQQKLSEEFIGWLFNVGRAEFESHAVFL